MPKLKIPELLYDATVYVGQQPPHTKGHLIDVAEAVPLVEADRLIREALDKHYPSKWRTNGFEDGKIDGQYVHIDSRSGGMILAHYDISAVSAKWYELKRKYKDFEDLSAEIAKLEAVLSDEPHA